GCRLGRPRGEEVEDDKPAACPPRRKPQAAPDGWIIRRGIGRGRIEHDERGGARARPEQASQQVAVTPAWRDDGIMFHLSRWQDLHLSPLLIRYGDGCRRPDALARDQPGQAPKGAECTPRPRLSPRPIPRRFPRDRP